MLPKQAVNLVNLVHQPVISGGNRDSQSSKFQNAGPKPSGLAGLSPFLFVMLAWKTAFEAWDGNERKAVKMSTVVEDYSKKKSKSYNIFF